jgi:hypothetical protein
MTTNLSVQITEVNEIQGAAVVIGLSDGTAVLLEIEELLALCPAPPSTSRVRVLVPCIVEPAPRLRSAAPVAA